MTLNAADPRTPLSVDHRFLTDPRDADVLAAGVEEVRRLAETRPLRRYAARETTPGPEVGAEEHVRAAARGFFHPTGTCAIVADASIMPAIPRANTNLTTVALAERIAESL